MAIDPMSPISASTSTRAAVEGTAAGPNDRPIASSPMAGGSAPDATPSCGTQPSRGEAPSPAPTAGTQPNPDAAPLSPPTAATASAATGRGSIRSYVLRRARYSVAQQEAWSRLMPRYGIPWSEQLLDLQGAFGRDAPTVLEIGFGMGAATVALADVRPDLNILGVEVHTPGVGALLREVEQRGLTNVRVIEYDAAAVLRTMIADESLDSIHIWFPDPWPKARHHKRRLITPETTALLARKLKAGGCLHLATDWAHYALQMQTCLDATPALVRNASALGNHPLLATDADRLAAALPPIPDAEWGESPRPEETEPIDADPRPPWRALTRFEARGLKRGDPGRDFLRWKVAG